MRHYCTLFDSSYATMGLTMLESLQRFERIAGRDGARYHVLALDERAGRLAEMLAAFDGWKNRLSVTTESDLLKWDPGLRKIKAERPHREWCWGLASIFMHDLLGTEPSSRSLPADFYPCGRSDTLTYLDADLYFFSRPDPCYEALGNKSIAIHPHHFPPSLADRAASSGRFNVGWVMVQANEVGVACVDAWARNVRSRCDAETCGDQKYLDDWPRAFGERLAIMADPWIASAPWMCWAHEVGPGPTMDGHPIVFHHFHEWKRTVPFSESHPANTPFYARRTLGYPLRQEDHAHIYEPYEAAHRAMERRVVEFDRVVGVTA